VSASFLDHGLAQAGTSVFDGWFESYWLVLLVKLVVVVGFFLTAPLLVGYMEHKVLAHMQARLGPMYAGRFHGWAQLLADGVKFIQKEDVIPAAADPWIYSIAPGVVLVPYLITLVVIPFSPTIWALNLDVGIFFVLAISSVGVIGTLMAGWASANKFSLIGALRAAAQLIAYELPLVLAAAAVVMQAGTLSMVGITESQAGLWNIARPWQWIGFAAFVVAALAEINRPPFDMPVADSEIIFGALTEYTGLKFAFFLLTEYAGIVVLSAIASVLFLGGYRALPGLSFVPAPLWMAAKIGGLAFFVIWLRATYPRLREDQLQRFSWQVLIPLTLLQILVVAVIKIRFA
jgi:NADH-quinone oxidoreductase subunit H